MLETYLSLRDAPNPTHWFSLPAIGTQPPYQVNVSDALKEADIDIGSL